MKRIIIITIITCLLIPFFSINTFASTYDLGSPVLWTSPYPNNSSDPYPLALPYSRTFDYMLVYYDFYPSPAGFHDDYIWSLISNSNITPRSLYYSISYRARDKDLDDNLPALALGVKPTSSSTINNSLFIPSLEYDGFYWPSDNQVIKIEFSLDTYVLGTNNGIPDIYHDYLDPEDLCFFTVTSGNSNSDVTMINLAPHFSSVVVSPSLDSRKINFTYYFNAYGDSFSDLKKYVDDYYPGEKLSLVVRFPYYFGSSSLISDGAYIVSNADLPVSYEVMTPGDYSQELSNIKNAITESNENLLNYYNTLSGEDKAVIVHAKQQNDKLDSAIKDYDNAQSGIDNIIEHVTLPPVNIDDANSTFDDIGLGNISENESIWSPFIVAMTLVTFTFAGLSLLLYGKKG